MPSARPSKFSGGGLLRNQDGQIVALQFTDVQPERTGPPKPGQKKSDFRSLFAVLSIQADGAESVVERRLFVGSADDYEIVNDGVAIAGEKQLGKSSGWYIFLDSLVKPAEGEGFDENNFEDDPEGLIADYSPIIGARCRFDWRANEKVTKKYGQVKAKSGKTYDREDLIVTAYYGNVDVPEPVVVKTATKPSIKTAVKPAVSSTKGKASKGVDITELAVTKVQEVVKAAKNKTLTKNQLSVKLLTAMSTEPEHREAVRTWASNDENLGAIDGIEFDAETNTLKAA